MINKKLLLLGLGLITGCLFFSLTVDRRIPQTADKVSEESKLSVSNYFPVEEGQFWQYQGTNKEEQVGGKVETSKVSKRIEISQITTEPGAEIISVLNNKEVQKWVIKDNAIDFEPDEAEDKFILKFPLYVGQKWGDEESLRYRDDGYYVWEVEKKLTQEILGKKYDECFRIAFKTLPDMTYQIFCYGIGIPEEGYKHNGTVLEYVYKLIDHSGNRLLDR